MKAEVLKILRNAPGYVSGQSVCSALGVSRTAVWKAVSQLKEEGYEFDAVSNRGYRIVKYPDIVTEAEIMSRLDEGDIVEHVVYFDSTDSTNNQAKLYAEKGAAHGTLFVAGQQTAGRGRRGRQWVAGPDSGIWMTLLLRPQIGPPAASMLTLVAAMAVAEAVSEECSGSECRIKWPNDIVAGGKKICGILTEMSAETDWVNYVVIGIGINVNTQDFPEEIRQTASSLLLEYGHRVGRSGIIASFSKHFTKHYNDFIKETSLAGMVDSYNAILANAGREVRIEDPAGGFTGRAIGIDETGALKVDRGNGIISSVIAGEVSVRGLYGYV